RAMTPERWKKLETIFHQALDLGEEARPAFLSEACGEDEMLRREAERLIAASEGEDSFIDSPICAEAVEPSDGNGNRSMEGRFIGPYRIVSLLGRGGMGEVYLAEDTRLERKIALKLLPADHTRDPDRVRRFEREAKAASALNHPNILTIHEIGETDGIHYIVSEHVEGSTLRAMMQRGRPGINEAITIAEQITAALSVAHESGIIHRDIKPENVMVRPDGLVKVLDFGLAKLTESQSPAVDSQTSTVGRFSTEPGVVMGTVSYMSPEQVRGLEVDRRTDVFSLGVMLYEVIAGRRPFEGATVIDLIAALLTAEPPPLRQHCAEATEELEQITAKCLAKDQEARYQSADELLTDLRALKIDLITDPTIDSAKSRRKLPGRPFPSWHTTAIAALVILALVILAAMTIVYTLFSRTKPVTQQPEVRSLAVLPFKSLNREAVDEYLGLGIADAIITRTSRMKTLIVRPISAVRSYHDQEADPLEAGRHLQVDAVLDGSVQRVGDHLRVTLNLRRVQDGVSLWAEALDQEMKHAFALQDDISSNVARALHLTLTAGEEKQLASPPTRNAEAYDYYLRGRYYLAQQTGESLRTAMTMFERAAALDPNFALAHAGLADASIRIFFGADTDKKYEERAFIALEKALALDPELAEAYVIRANLTWNIANRFPHERAYKEHQRALAINPNLASAHASLAGHIIHIGLFDKAMDALQTTLRLEPNNSFAPPRIARIYWYQQKYEQALELYEKSAYGGFLAEKALTLWHLGLKVEAFAELEKGLKQPSLGRGSRADLQAAYAILLADAGNRRKAEEHILLAVESGQGLSHFHHAAFSIACAYALIGEKQSAMEWLERTAEEGMPCYPLFDTEPALNSLRDDPQFKSFMEKMKKQYEGYLRDLG
ncbi:MAG TPA: protein kinase, partial [Blastocatellia bacterium]|nr:protein kinase [Blastocatellia bacterium]